MSKSEEPIFLVDPEFFNDDPIDFIDWNCELNQLSNKAKLSGLQDLEGCRIIKIGTHPHINNFFTIDYEREVDGKSSIHRSVFDFSYDYEGFATLWKGTKEEHYFNKEEETIKDNTIKNIRSFLKKIKYKNVNNVTITTNATALAVHFKYEEHSLALPAGAIKLLGSAYLDALCLNAIKSPETFWKKLLFTLAHFYMP